MIPTDFDGDQQVDISDLNIMAHGWLNCNDPADPKCVDVLPQPTLNDSTDNSITLQTTLPQPVHHWPLDEDATDGATVAHDILGGKDGTIRGAKTREGKIGNALHFDGSNDDVEINNFNTSNLKSMTISFWINPDEGTLPANSYKRIISAGDHWEVIIQTNSSNLANNLYQAGGTFPKGNSDVPEGQWTHVAMTSTLGTNSQPGRMEIYVNGEFDVGGNFADDDWTGGTFYMALREDQPNQRFKGMLDDVRIYDTVLDAQQIVDIFNDVAGGNYPPQVDAGPDQNAFYRGEPVSIQISADISDDGQPEPATLKWFWEVVSPIGASVWFEPSVESEAPLVTFIQPSVYTLKLTADDSELQSSDLIVVTVTEANCQYIIDHGLVYVADVSGPDDEPDCLINLYDFSYFATYWLTEDK